MQAPIEIWKPATFHFQLWIVIAMLTLLYALLFAVNLRMHGSARNDHYYF